MGTHPRQLTALADTVGRRRLQRLTGAKLKFAKAFFNPTVAGGGSTGVRIAFYQQRRKAK